MLQSLSHTYQRYRTLQTHRISALPIVILMPHSACNCRCVMCDIWKNNKNLKQLTEQDVTGLLSSLTQFGTKQVVMSGGEALLNQNFFTLCQILKDTGINVSLLSTGLTLKNHTEQLVKWVDDIVVSLDGDQQLHDAIRNIPGAFTKLEEGVTAIRALDPNYRITARTVIHRLNFRNWTAIIDAVKQMDLDQISFLPADVSSQAFNRQMAWDQPRQNEILLSENELPELKAVIEKIFKEYQDDLDTVFIAEPPRKLIDIYHYYSAFYGLSLFPYKKCNAPWVSAVIEADGAVRPCFFHEAMGNIRDSSLEDILNSSEAVNFRKTLNMTSNEICKKCVARSVYRP